LQSARLLQHNNTCLDTNSTRTKIPNHTITPSQPIHRALKEAYMTTTWYIYSTCTT
jgi:hypothetical protein